MQKTSINYYNLYLSVCLLEWCRCCHHAGVMVEVVVAVAVVDGSDGNGGGSDGGSGDGGRW